MNTTVKETPVPSYCTVFKRGRFKEQMLNSFMTVPELYLSCMLFTRFTLAERRNIPSVCRPERWHRETLNKYTTTKLDDMRKPVPNWDCSLTVLQNHTLLFTSHRDGRLSMD